MPERLGAPLFLVARFSEYYEQVAAIRLAIAEGRLGAMLAVGDEPTPTEPVDLAARVSARLANVIKTQRADIARTGTPAEIDAYRRAAYAMAALTDEQFIFPENEWPGAHAWMDVLLEYQLFHSRNAGVHFFTEVEALLQSRAREPLESELAAVMLLALRLGFRGRYREGNGEQTLHSLRTRLFHLIERDYDDFAPGPSFPQALSQLQCDGTPARLAPLTPWLISLGVALAAYLVVSSAIWLALVEPLREFLKGG
jgi:type VI secretion system protein ImpK